MRFRTLVFNVARILAAVIMLQTLYFKFTAAEESVYIFTRMGLEPWGRLGVGVGELLASALLLYKPISWVGAALAVGLMSGALLAHIFLLGIEIMSDGGYLFALALAVLVCSVLVVYEQREKMKHLLVRLNITAK